MLAQMNDVYKHMKMLLDVNKNGKIVIKSELRANIRFLGAHECIFALLLVNSRK